MSLGKVFAPVPSEFLLIASTALLLTGFGLVMVLSATSATATAAGEPPYDAVAKQAVFAVIGIPLMFIASRLPISFWKRAAWPALIGAIVFQLLVFTPLGYELYGNRNWISDRRASRRSRRSSSSSRSRCGSATCCSASRRCWGCGGTCSSRSCPCRSS